MINYNLKVLKFLPMNFMKILVLFLCSTLFSTAFDSSQCLAQCNAKFTASVEGGKTGEMVTVKINVTNFTDIGGIQWTMRWDPAVIEYTSVQDLALTDLSLGSFNLTKVAQGYFTTSWYNQQGVTKADGSTIFTIKFKLLGADGKSSNIDFSNTPLQIEISDKNAQKCSNAVLTSGKINIGTVVNPPAGLGLKVGTADANGSEVCVPVTVTGFKSITAMQFSLGWDTSKLKFTKVQNFTTSGLSGFDSGNFGSALGPLGKISCVWIDQNTTGQTVVDGKALFEICYTYKGACPGSAAINITDDPTRVVFNSTTGAVTATKENGSVNGASCTSLNVTATKITHPCPGSTNGGIEITTTGASSNATYLWSNGATSKNLSGVGNGTYNVTVTDAGKTATFQNAVVLTGLTVTSSKTDPTAGQSNGSITLTVAGGNLPNTYSWSNGATTKDVNNLPAGTYSYTVTDAAGCKVGPISVTIGTVNTPFDIPSANIVATSVQCAGQATGSIVITPIGGTPQYTYAWSGPGGFTATTKDILNLKAGTYKVTAKDAANATVTKDVIVTEPSAALTVTGTTKQPSSKTAQDGSITLTVNGGTPAYSFRWSDGSTNKDRTLLPTGDYTVTVTDSKGCTASAPTFKLTGNVDECFTSIKAFTPNGDGINELFIINCADNINNQLLVYNRWNQLVFTTNNYRNNWNGIDNNGYLLPDGTYYWILKDNSGVANTLYKGYVALVRSLN